MHTRHGIGHTPVHTNHINTFSNYLRKYRRDKVFARRVCGTHESISCCSP